MRHKIAGAGEGVTVGKGSPLPEAGTWNFTGDGIIDISSADGQTDVEVGGGDTAGGLIGDAWVRYTKAPVVLAVPPSANVDLGAITAQGADTSWLGTTGSNTHNPAIGRLGIKTEGFYVFHLSLFGTDSIQATNEIPGFDLNAWSPVNYNEYPDLFVQGAPQLVQQSDADEGFYVCSLFLTVWCNVSYQITCRAFQIQTNMSSVAWGSDFYIAKVA